MKKRYIYYFLLLLLLADLTYSFLQHSSMPLDGDMAGGIVPGEDVKPILKDPFGVSVLTQNAVYPNPNRYFAHWTYYTYFNRVPLLLQSFVSPIESVYLASAIAKILIQFLIMTLLAFYITGRQKIFSFDFLVAAILVAPLFQTNGYRSHIGIIDPSITYTFFYALPCAMLLLFYLPFFFDSVYGTEKMKNPFLKIFTFMLGIFIVFNGALNPGIILIVTLLFGVMNYFQTDKNLSFPNRVIHTFYIVPKTYMFFFTLVGILSLYGLYIGTNNSIFLYETTSIGERYSRIPLGIITVVRQKIVFPIFLTMIGINVFLLRKNQNIEIKKSLRIFSWIGIFSLVYILLLPLGGYKGYRPYILRYDTIMPITIGLIFIYSKSSFQLIEKFEGKKKYAYILLITLFTFVFTNADKPGFDKNEGEKLALLKISKSKEKTVFIETNCTILSWDKVTDSAKSALNGKLLKKWKITSNNKLYYQNK